MKNLNIIKIFALFSAVIFLQAFSASGAKAAACDRTNGEILASNFSSNGTCTVTPDVAMFPLHKIGLCEEVPTYENYLTNCKFLIEYSTPKDVQVSKNTVIQLNDSITLDEGTYKAAVLVVGNTIGLKHSDVFATSHNGNEVDDDEFNVSQGKYCSTRAYTGNQDMFDSANGGVSDGEVATLESFLDCSDEALTPGLYKEDKGAYESNSLCTISSDLVVAPSALTTTNSTVGKVQICAMAANGTTPAQPGVKQLAIQTLPTSVIINANTSSIDVGFELTDMLLLEQHNANGTLSGGSISSYTFTNAFVESVGLKITTK
ncbi:hypothetical protein N8Z41_00050 [Amylibacter sp.]|jgi:hypothetical protein|nr:hypothetical protein [Amylibacter sp.]MDC1246861.1 hypothetical protein [Amylibacter sp.]